MDVVVLPVKGELITYQLLMTQFLYFQENVRPMEILVLKFVSTFTIICMNAAVKMVSSSVQMDIIASPKVSYNRRKIDMLQESIFLRLSQSHVLKRFSKYAIKSNKTLNFP